MAHNAHPPLSPKGLEEAFIKVTFEEDATPNAESAAADPLYDPWVDQGACYGLRAMERVR